MTEGKSAAGSAGADVAATRDWKRFLGRIAGSLLMLALLLWYLPRDQLFESLAQVSMGIWLSGVSIYLCLHLIGVAKWRMLINSAGAGMTFAQVARCYYYGLFGNTFLPSVVGGDIVRVGLAMQIGRSRSAILLGSVADRSIDTLGLALVAGMAALFIPRALDEQSQQIFWGLAVLVAAAGAFVLLLSVMLPVQRMPFSWRRRIGRIRVTGRQLVRRPGRMLFALVSSMVLQTSQVVMNFWLGRLAMIQHATLLMWLFVWPLAKLAALVPVTQGGIGLREAAQGVLFVPFGVSMEKAVATGLIFQAIVISGNLISGVIAKLLGHLQPPGTPEPGFNLPAPRRAHRAGLLGAVISGGAVFFGANVLAIAYGTGAAGSAWVDWMTALPGFSPSFAGSCLGLVYGAVPGYVLGRLAAMRCN